MAPHNHHCDTAADVVKRVIELFVVSWALETGKLLDRVSEVMMVLIIFATLAFVSSLVRQQCDVWRSKLEEHKRAYASKRHLLALTLRSRLTTTTTTTEERALHPPLNEEINYHERLIDVLVETQIEEEPSGIVIVAYFLELATYIIHLAKLFVTFLLTKVLQDRFDASSPSSSSRILRMAKPIMLILMLYLEFTMPGYGSVF